MSLEEQRHHLAHGKPTIVRFAERALGLVHRDVNGTAFGHGRGEEQLLLEVSAR